MNKLIDPKKMSNYLINCHMKHFVSIYAIYRKIKNIIEVINK